MTKETKLISRTKAAMMYFLRAFAVIVEGEWARMVEPREKAGRLGVSKGLAPRERVE